MQIFSLLFKPKKWSANLLEGLRANADLVATACHLSTPEEHDSSHYVESTYFRWQTKDADIRLYWSDESDTDEFLCLEVRSDQEAPILLKNFSSAITPLADEIRADT